MKQFIFQPYTATTENNFAISYIVKIKWAAKFLFKGYVCMHTINHNKMNEFSLVSFYDTLNPSLSIWFGWINLCNLLSFFLLVVSLEWMHSSFYFFLVSQPFWFIWKWSQTQYNFITHHPSNQVWHDICSTNPKIFSSIYYLHVPCTILYISAKFTRMKK